MVFITFFPCLDMHGGLGIQLVELMFNGSWFHLCLRLCHPAVTETVAGTARMPMARQYCVKITHAYDAMVEYVESIGAFGTYQPSLAPGGAFGGQLALL